MSRFSVARQYESVRPETFQPVLLWDMGSSLRLPFDNYYFNKSKT